MKKLVLLALVVMLMPAMVQGYDLKQGDPAFLFEFEGGLVPLIRGETYCDYAYCAQRGFYGSATCLATMDTFAVVSEDLEGWAMSLEFAGYEQGVEGEDAEGKCYIVDAVNGTWYYVALACITVPCEAEVGDLNTWTLTAVYCDDQMVAQPDSGDCEDPNTWGGSATGLVWSTMVQDFEVVESPPALYILQDTLYFIEQGQTAAYIPFSICNGDPCAPASDYNYTITSLGTIGSAPLDILDTITGVVGGDCGDVYGIIDAGEGIVCTYDTLTIVVWDMTGAVYDTCVQAVHVIEPVPVPLFTAPVVTILVLAMILAAAVIMKRHAVSKA